MWPAVHDYFEILGVAPDAEARDIREACARHAARPRVDLLEGERRPDDAAGRGTTDGPAPVFTDVAIDLPDMAGVVARMQAAFFRSPR